MPPPPAPTQAAGDAVIAIDVGGTTIKACTVDRSGRRGHPRVRPTARDDPSSAVAGVVAVAAELVAAAPGCGAVGLVVPGIVDADLGVGVHAENIGWRDVPFRQLLAGVAEGRAVAFGHDVRAAGEVERRFGAAAGCDDLAFIPIGTGLAAAMVVEGRALSGRFTGEIGHIDVGSGLPCPCGATGCLETVGSATAVATRYTRASGVPVRGAAEVLLAADAGDGAAAVVWQEAVDAIAAALTVYVSLLAPEVVVLGGGLAAAGDRLVAPLREALARRLVWRPMPTLLPAAFGEHAGLLGAALLAFDALGVEDLRLDPAISALAPATGAAA